MILDNLMKELCPLQSRVEAAMVVSVTSWAWLLSGVPCARQRFGNLALPGPGKPGLVDVTVGLFPGCDEP